MCVSVRACCSNDVYMLGLLYLLIRAPLVVRNEHNNKSHVAFSFLSSFYSIRNFELEPVCLMETCVWQASTDATCPSVQLWYCSLKKQTHLPAVEQVWQVRTGSCGLSKSNVSECSHRIRLMLRFLKLLWPVKSSLSLSEPQGAAHFL